MGYYIDSTKNGALNPKGKVQDLINYENAIIVNQPINFDDYLNYALICVVDNGPFEAAGYAFDKEEFEAFNYSKNDFRPKTWLIMDKERAKLLTGYRG